MTLAYPSTKRSIVKSPGGSRYLPIVAQPEYGLILANYKQEKMTYRITFETPFAQPPSILLSIDNKKLRDQLILQTTEVTTHDCIIELEGHPMATLEKNTYVQINWFACKAVNSFTHATIISLNDHR